MVNFHDQCWLEKTRAASSSLVKLSLSYCKNALEGQRLAATRTTSGLASLLDTGVAELSSRSEVGCNKLASIKHCFGRGSREQRSSTAHLVRRANKQPFYWLGSPKLAPLASHPSFNLISFSRGTQTLSTHMMELR